MCDHVSSGSIQFEYYRNEFNIIVAESIRALTGYGCKCLISHQIVLKKIILTIPNQISLNSIPVTIILFLSFNTLSSCCYPIFQLSSFSVKSKLVFNSIFNIILKHACMVKSNLTFYYIILHTVGTFASCMVWRSALSTQHYLPL